MVELDEEAVALPTHAWGRAALFSIALAAAQFLANTALALAAYPSSATSPGLLGLTSIAFGFGAVLLARRRTEKRRDLHPALRIVGLIVVNLVLFVLVGALVRFDSSRHASDYTSIVWLGVLVTTAAGTWLAMFAGSPLERSWGSPENSNDEASQTQDHGRGGGSDYITEIERLGELQSKGLISSTEFEEQKKRVLGGTSSKDTAPRSSAAPPGGARGGSKLGGSERSIHEEAFGRRLLEPNLIIFGVLGLVGVAAALLRSCA